MISPSPDFGSVASEAQSDESQINEDGRSNFIKSQQAIVDALSKETFKRGEPFVPPRPLSENGDEPERPGSTDCSNAGSVRSGICLFGE